MTPKDIIKYCNREAGFQARVYPGQVASGKLKREQAKQYQDIILLYRKIMTKLDEKNLTVEDLMDKIEKMKPREKTVITPGQGSLFG